MKREKREVTVNTAEMFRFLAADGKYARIRWVTTGEEEKCLVKVVNPGIIELTREDSSQITRIYPKDAGRKVKFLQLES
jgi:hypothetical protein